MAEIPNWVDMTECSSTVLLTHTVEPDASEVISEAWFYAAT